MSMMFDLEPPEEGKNMRIDEEKDLSPFHDNGIRKVLKEHGYGDEYPNSGDTVTLRYVAYNGVEMHPEYIFDSSENDGKDFVYEVCRGKVVRGFELAVLSMRVGERAIIYLKPEYAFGRTGAEPRVPKDTPVIFDTKILKIECQDLSQAKDRSILKKVIKKGRGWGQPNEGCLIDRPPWEDQNEVVKDRWSLFTVHIKGTYDDVVFQDCDITFPLGEGKSKKFHIPPFIEDLLDQWKIGEKARLFYAANQAFGAEGYRDLGIPPNKDVTYVLEMKNYERIKDIWEMDTDEKLQQCYMFKDKGNMYYNNEEWDLALKFYERISDFIEYDVCMDGEDEVKRRNIMATGLLNKAMVLLKLDRNSDARDCCEKVLEFDDTSVKAWYRRGLTFVNTNDWKEAKADFEKVLELDPTNKAAKNHIRLCSRKIIESSGTERQLYQKMTSGIGRGTDNDRRMYGSGMNDIDMWDNTMAQGMMTLEEEREAFGEPMPPRGGNNHGIEH